MAKKNKKSGRTSRQQKIFELSIVLYAYANMNLYLKKIDEKTSLSKEEAELKSALESVLKRLTMVISVNKPNVDTCTEIVGDILDSENNVLKNSEALLTGVNLLIYQHSIKGKQLTLSIVNHLHDIEGYLIDVEKIAIELSEDMDEKVRIFCENIKKTIQGRF